MSSGLRLNVAELLRRPGTTKDVVVEVAAVDIGLNEPRISGDATLAGRFHVESLSDGLTVTGSVSAPWSDTCRRCLVEISAVTAPAIRELFQLTITDPDAYPVVGEQIDFTELMRDAIALELPLAALCRPECAGICATCGTDLNERTCECSGPPPDPRWGALDALKFDE